MTCSAQDIVTIYCDWNVVQYLARPEKLVSDLRASALGLRAVIAQYIDRDIWVFPRSHAHFLDINQGGPKYESHDLAILGEFTGGWRVYEDRADNYTLAINQFPDIAFEYAHCISTTRPPPLPWSILMGTVTGAVAFAFKIAAFLYPTGKKRELIRRLADCLQSPGSSGLEIFRINKEMRTAFAVGSDFAIVYPEIRNVSHATDPATLRNLVDECIAESSLSFLGDHEGFFRIFNRDNLSFLSPFTRDVLKLTDLADFVALVSEKLKKETAFDSITNDQIHLTHGLQCDRFVTADKRLAEKARFIKTWKDLPVRVFDMDGLAVDILRQVARQAAPNAQKLPFNYVVKENGQTVKKYIVPPL